MSASGTRPQRGAWLGLVFLAMSAMALDAQEVVEEPRERRSIRDEVREAFGSHLFTVVGEDTPRLFFRSRPRQARVVVRNDGHREWSAAEGYALSYHWLGSDGEMVVKNGLRTPVAAVAPGATFEARVTVQPPPTAGSFRLQWDMVQEEVTWFSARDPSSEPPLLALVLPRLELFLGSLVPVLAALAALALVEAARRRPASDWIPRAAASADLLWCGVSVFFKPQMLYREVTFTLTSTAHWITLSCVTLALLLLLPWGRFRPWLAWGLAAFSTLWVWADALYYRFFTDFVSAASFLGVRQSGDLLESAQHLSVGGDVLVALDLVLGAVLVRRMWALRQGPRPAGVFRRLLPAVLLALVAAPGLWMARPNPEVSTIARDRPLPPLRSVQRNGLYGFQIKDLAKTLRRRLSREPLSDVELAETVAWFEKRTPRRAGTGPWFGFAEGMNLLVVQVESLQQFAVGLEIEGQRVMPQLARLADSALVFTDVRDQTGWGRSSDGDFLSFTGLLPVTASVAYEYPGNRYTTLAHALGGRGYRTLSAIPFSRTFWNRQLTFPAYGFEDNWFREEFDRGEAIGWGLNDRDLLRQMARRLPELEEPFAAWLITLSLHYPYPEFPDDQKRLDFGALEGSSLGNYLHAMELFDRALGELFRSLEENGLRDRTVVALWGDHDSTLHHRHEYAELLGIERSRLGRYLSDRVPAMIWVPGEGAPAGMVDLLAGHTDMPPTLMALLGIDPAGYAFVGRNLLGDPDRVPIPHPRGSWTDGEVVYLVEGESSDGPSCWEIEGLRQVPLADCAEGDEWVAEQLSVAERVLVYDLQERITGELRAAAPGPPTSGSPEPEAPPGP